MTTERTVTVEEAAEIGGYGLVWLYKLCHEGSLGAYREGRFWRIPLENVPIKQDTSVQLEFSEEDLKSEIWKTNVNYPGCEISSLGRVKGRRGTIKKIHAYKGFLRTGIESKKGKYKPSLISRLVYETFIGPVSEGMYISYKDGNPFNCKVSNLELTKDIIFVTISDKTKNDVYRDYLKGSSIKELEEKHGPRVSYILDRTDCSVLESKELCAAYPRRQFHSEKPFWMILHIWILVSSGMKRIHVAKLYGYSPSSVSFIFRDKKWEKILEEGLEPKIIKVTEEYWKVLKQDDKFIDFNILEGSFVGRYEDYLIMLTDEYLEEGSERVDYRILSYLCKDHFKRKPRHNFTDEDLQEMRCMVSEGRSHKQIADKFACAAGYVSYLLNKPKKV